MSSANDFLKKVLSAHNLKNDAEEIDKVREERDNVEKIIKDKYPEAKKTIRYGGSYAKDTMVKDNYDLDILCYFHSDETSAGDTLEDIYNNIKDCLKDDYFVEPKRSALKLKNKDDKNDFHIDVVPGRFVENGDGDAFLYQKGAEKDRLKTNPDKHIDHIKNSGFTNEIKLFKVWKIQNAIELKTFVLELLVVKVLKGRKDKTLSDNLKYFWTEMKDNIDNISIEDPANSNNDLSDIFSSSVKNSIKSVSEIAINNIENDNWESIFELEDENSEDKDNSEKKKTIESFASSASSTGTVAKSYAERKN